jgi:hypothetical protein
MKEGTKTCKPEAQECLRHGKGRRNINETKLQYGILDGPVFPEHIESE